MGDTVETRLLVRSPDELDVAWAQRVVDRNARGVRVVRVTTERVEIGTTTRVRLAVDHEGPPDLPRRWFVKLPSGSWKARVITALPRLPQTEVRFYNEVAERLAVERPRALAAVSRRTRGYTLVLGDVADGGGVPGRSGDALCARQAGAVVDLLARLHARFWEDAALDTGLAWLSGPVRRLEDRLGTALAVPLMRRGLRRAGGAIAEALHEPALRYARYRREAMRRLAAGPRTLVHHDCHPGNLYWRGDEAGLLDWQLVRVGDGIGDVAYLLATGLLPEVRRDAEEDLLAHYGDALARQGVRAPRADQQRRRYRAHLTYAFEAMVVTLAVGGLMDDAVASEMVRRTSIAVQDHDAFAAVLRDP